MKKINHKLWIKSRFNLAAKDYFLHSKIQRRIGLDLLTIIPDLAKRSTMVDLGGGNGYFTTMLNNILPENNTILVDFSYDMIKQYKSVNSSICADFDFLPFAEKSIDFIFSNMALQWSVQLNHTLLEIYRSLKNEGYLLFSMPIQGTFEELKYSWQKMDNHQHTNTFYTQSELYSLLINCGYKIEKIFSQNYVTDFSDVLALFKHIKKTGASYVMQDKRPGLLTKHKMHLLNDAYKNYQTASGNLALTYHIIFILAKK